MPWKLTTMTLPATLAAALLGCRFATMAGAEPAMPESQVLLPDRFALPEGAAKIDVTDFGAVPDDGEDDTDAIKAAIDATHNAWEQIYFPAGTYDVSDTIRWRRFLTLRGEGPGRTILRLSDHAPGFDDPDNPKPVLFCRLIDDPKKNNNTSHSNHIYHMSIEVGAGNAGAVGIDYASHNGGTIRNVLLSAAHGSGHKGISMDRNGPGPAMVKRVRVEGFDHGISTSWGLYSMTFEDIELVGQRTAGFLSNSHNATIRRLFSDNAGPVVRVEPGRDYGLLVLMDSQLRGGSSSQAAVDADGEILLRNVTTDGYGRAVRDGDTSLDGPRVEGYSSSPVLGPDSQPVDAFGVGLNVRETPELPWIGDFTQWANVRDYEHLKEGDSWAPAIQAAIDSGRQVVYFPNNTHASYPAEGEVIVRGNVRWIVGLWARIDGCRLVFKNEHPVAVEQMRNFELIPRGSAPVTVMGSLGVHLKTSPRSPDTFIEDVLGIVEVRGSRVWIRQFNEESMRSPKIVNDGGELWVFNLKTEQGGQVLHNRNGARTEILGGVIYPAQGAHDVPMYRNDASALAVFHREVSAGYPHFIRDDGALLDPPFAHGVRYVSPARPSR